MSRLVRFLPLFRAGLHNGPSRGGAVRPWRGSSSNDPMTNAWKFFANELRSMEREMSRIEHDVFRGSGINASSFFRPLASLFSNALDTTSSGALSQRNNSNSGGGISDYIVEDKDGNKKLQLEFDAAGFRPEDIEISTRSGNRLEVHAKYEDKSDGHRVYQEYSKVITLPEGVDIKQLTCNFENNSLILEAPYTPPVNKEQNAIGSSSASSAKGPRKIDVKHLGESDGISSSAGDEVEGGSKPMVGGTTATEESWPPRTSSSSVGSGALPQQDAVADKAAARAGSRF